MEFFKRDNLIEQIKAKVIDYRTNPQNYVYFSKVAYEDNTTITYYRKPLSEAIGLEKLGEGAYSTVYAIDDKRALKIVRNEDEGYATFVQFLKTNGRKYSCFPKVYYSGNWAGVAVYVIERLETITDENEEDRRFLAAVINNCIRGKPVKGSRYLNLPADFFEAMNELRDYYRNSHNSDGYCVGFDMHCENVLIRANGDPVITDPFS